MNNTADGEQQNPQSGASNLSAPPDVPPSNPVNQLPAGEPSGSAGNKPQPREREDIWIVRCHFALVFIGAIQAAFVFWQLRLMDRQLDEMKIASQISKSAIDQSERAITATIENSKLDQRAWVGLKTGELTVFEVGKPITATIYFSNSGKTPAIKLTNIAHIATSKNKITDGTAFRKWADQQHEKSSSWKPRSTTALFPGVEMSVASSTPADLTKETMDDIKSGRQTVYVIGDIVYEDVFNVSRYTRFFYSYSAVRKALVSEPTYNDAH